MRYSFSLIRECLRGELLERETVAQTEEFIRALAAEAEKVRCARLLISVRNSRPIFQVGQYRISEYFARVISNPKVRVALLADSRELRAAHEYIELLGRQRGANVRSFLRENDAIVWLLEEGSAGLAAADVTINASETPSPRVRILVVDDDRDTVLTLGILLRSEGYDTHLVQSGTEALIKAAELRPDVVLLDIGMPGQDGFEVAKELVRRFGSERPVLIAVTAHTDSEDRRKADISGFHHFVAKPYDHQALLALLSNVKAPSTHSSVLG